MSEYVGPQGTSLSDALGLVGGDRCHVESAKSATVWLDDHDRKPRPAPKTVDSNSR